MRKLALTIVVLLLFGIAFGVSGCATLSLEDLQKQVQLNPNDAEKHFKLGRKYYQPEGWGKVDSRGYSEAIASYKEAIRINPDHINAHDDLANIYYNLGRYQEAIAHIKEVLRIAPFNSNPFSLVGGSARYLLRDAEQKIAQAKLAPPVRQPPPQPPAKQTPRSGTGSGFFVSKMGHVITNAHVVENCDKVTIGDNANKQVLAELINTDRSNDLALLKLSTLEMASAESQSLIQKLGIVVVPLATNGLLRNEDVRLGEKVLVAGYPFGEFFSNTIKVTTGVVSATRGAGDDSGQFQLDAAVQPGNSGGPIYDSSGNIVGVVISQLDKLKVAKAIGSLPENVNFGIKASTVRQFLTSSGLPSKKSERTEEKSTEQLAEIAQNQALMVMCLQ
jgi:S1-C subfamily serine protease